MFFFHNESQHDTYTTIAICELPFTYGVPQGSILSLKSIDLFKMQLNGSIFKYPDDTAFVVTVIPGLLNSFPATFSR